MLENLVESKKRTGENLSLSKFMLTTFVLMLGLCLSGVLWSLFAKDVGIGNAGFDLSTLLAPVPPPEVEPPPPVEQQTQDNSPRNSEEIIRHDSILRIDEPPLIPKDISVTPNTKKPRPDAPFSIKPDHPETSGNYEKITTGTEKGIQSSHLTKAAESEKEEPPPTIKKTAPEVKPQKDTFISGGVVNGKALNLPKPPYPAAAQAVRAGGDVQVQVTIDENGSVISAKAISGHPLLRDVSEKAARMAKFSPTYLSKEAVKVTGIIVYKFSRN